MPRSKRLSAQAKAALRQQQGRVSSKVTVRRVEPEARRKPQIVRGDSPISDRQRLLLGELRREFHIPRHDIRKLTRGEAQAEIGELLRRRCDG